MNVLSLFDGMSCGQIALQKLGIKVDNYFACEIDKYAIQVTQNNFPDTIQLGDVQFVTKQTLGNHKIDLILGGSPCQGFSFAGKNLNFQDPRSALFFEFVRLVKELKPKYFLLENVRMKKESRDIISEYMGCEPIEINSALMSAQNRRRLYWTNIPGVTQPEDKGIVLKDILESEFDKLMDISGDIQKPINPNSTNQINPDKSAKSKSSDEKGTQPHMQDRVFDIRGKSHALTASFANHTNVGKIKADAAQKDNVLAKDKLYWRKLTPIECERLQTVPDNYTDCVSNTQRYKMLGNGWTVDVVAHILKGINIS